MKKIGRYEVVEELGRGAMGVVYKASDPTIGRLVAVKVLSLEPSKEKGVPGPRDIFMREARAAGRLSHPGIVTIHDALEDSESGNNYIVMEFVPGRTLEDVLHSGVSLEPAQALDVVRQVAEALDYAHRQGIIHRDMKPANVLLTDDGRVKITDFGIAKIAAREGALRTAAIMGTPSYMSPEQVTGGEVDARSDLFSLGIILYLMLVGQKPFIGDTAAVLFKIVYEDPVSPSQTNPKLGAGHDYLVLRSLAKDRDKRYATAREFVDDLDDVAQGRPPRSEAKLPLAELRAGERTVMAPAPFVGRAAEGKSATGKKSVWVAMIAGVGVACLTGLVGVGVWWFRRGAAQPTLPRAAPATGAVRPAPTRGAIHPSSTSSQPRPAVASIGATPAEAAKPAARAESAAETAPASTPVATRTVQLQCRYEFKEATLTISSGTNVVFRGSLKGKKKGGFLGIKGGYIGTLSRPISIPAGARELSLRVVTPDGSVDLRNTISLASSTRSSATLHLVASHDGLTFSWRTPPTHP